MVRLWTVPGWRCAGATYVAKIKGVANQMISNKALNYTVEANGDGVVFIQGDGGSLLMLARVKEGTDPKQPQVIYFPIHWIKCKI